MAGFLKEAELAATIRQWASSPCAPFPCGEEVWAYACAVSGIAAPPLPEHSSRRAVTALLKEKGGLVAYAGDLMASLGWEQVGWPGRGDVGVAVFPGTGLICAICLDGNGGLPLWMAKGDHHVLSVRAPFRQAWRASCRKR